jgi:hypothetical protein
MPETNTDKPRPFLTGLLTKMWEVFLEKLLVPVIMGALALGFATCQQQASQKMVDDVYQKVAEKLNKELPTQLEALRKQINTQGELTEQLRVAVLELNIRHKLEDSMRRPVRPAQPEVTKGAAASQPADHFKLLKARSVTKPLAPFRQTQVKAKMF